VVVDGNRVIAADRGARSVQVWRLNEKE
jgi:hypothetical protein